MRTLFQFIAIFTVVVLIAGCGGGGKKLSTIEVTGTVTYNGAPLSGASVTFAPVSEGQGNPAYGRTDAAGHYTLQTSRGNVDAGTTPGKYRVAIRKREAIPPTEEGKELTRPANTSDTEDGQELTESTDTPEPESLIPVRYESYSTSELTATVEKGKPNVFNFALKD